METRAMDGGARAPVRGGQDTEQGDRGSKGIEEARKREGQPRSRQQHGTKKGRTEEEGSRRGQDKLKKNYSGLLQNT